MDGSTISTMIDSASTTEVVALLVAITVAVLLVFVATGRRRVRSAGVAERFGAEYGRVVDEKNSPRRAVASLTNRVQRREGYELRPLSPEDRTRLQQRWVHLQAGFIDVPAFTAQAAVELVHELAVERGYTSDSTQACLDDLSVDHPELVASLQRARSEARTWSTTEHHRTIVVHARSVFDRLVADPQETVAPPDATMIDAARLAPPVALEAGDAGSASPNSPPEDRPDTTAERPPDAPTGEASTTSIRETETSVPTAATAGQS